MQRTDSGVGVEKGQLEDASSKLREEEYFCFVFLFFLMS